MTRNSLLTIVTYLVDTLIGGDSEEEEEEQGEKEALYWELL